MSAELPVEVKIMLVGNAGVGKTNILNMLRNNKFTNEHIPTIGIDFFIKHSHLDGHDIKMKLWDAAGGERFHNILTTYYKGTNVIIVVYAVDDKSSFEAVPKWFQEAESSAHDTIVTKVLIANKIDSPNDDKVTFEDGHALAKKIGAAFYEVSAMNNLGVEAPFHFAARKCLPEPNKLDGTNTVKQAKISAPVPSGLTNKPSGSKLKIIAPIVAVLLLILGFVLMNQLNVQGGL